MSNAETAREIANGTMPGGGSYQSPDDLCAAITAALDAKDKERQECIDAMEAEFDTEARCAGLRLIHETEPDTRGIGPPGTMVACRRFASPEGHVLTDDGVVRRVLGDIKGHTTKDGAIALVGAEVYHPDALDGQCVSVYSEDGTPEVDVPTERGRDNFICRSFRCDVTECYSSPSTPKGAERGQ